MSIFSGRQKKGAMREHRKNKREQAEERRNVAKTKSDSSVERVNHE